MSLVSVDLTDSGPALALPPMRKEMLSVGVTPEGKTLVRLNSSSLSIIQECMRKAQYSLEEKWHSESEAPATLFGRAVHSALEVFYKGDPEDRVLPKLEQLEPLAFGHGFPPTNNDLIFRAVESFVKVAEPLSALPESDKRSLQNGIWILHEYFKAYKDDPYVALVDERGPFIERTFTHRFYEDPTLVIDVFGTIDFAFRHLQTRQVILGDHKTASYLSFGGQSYFDREKPNHQYTMYMLGAKRVFGLDVSDFMVNVVEVKSRPKGKTAKGVSFPRQITKRTEEDYAELEEVILDSVHRYLYARSKGVWPQGGVDACNKYSGCPFKQVCASPKSLRETILKNKFTKGATDETK